MGYRNESNQPLGTKKEVFLRLVPFIVSVSAVILITVFCRVWLLDELPGNVTADEYDTLRTIVFLQESPSYLKTGFNWNGSSVISAHLIDLGWTLGGRTFASIKYSSIVLSTLSIIAFFITSYKVTRSYLIATTASIALAGQAAFLNFSRSGWENIFNALPAVVLGYYTYKLDKKLGLTTIDYLVLLATLTSSIYFYHPGKILVLVFMVIWFLTYVSHRLWRETLDISLLVFCLLLASVPFLVALYHHPVAGLDRIRAVNIFTQSNYTELIWQNIQNNTGALFYWTSNGGRYAPIGQVFHFPLNLLLVMGMVFSSIKYKKTFFFLVGSFLIVQILSHQTPDVSRAVHLIPVFFFTALLGFEYVLTHGISSSWARSVLIVICSLVFLATGYLDFGRYLSFINNPTTFNARKPGVKRADYNIWIDTMRQSAQTGGSAYMNADTWELQQAQKK